ncbi:small nuclear ribonucleoprotein-associated protein B [Trichophyton mentagrophytes]|uniref:Sm protein B n=2 Tax=Trichophyton interdigitale TaxID=101480 RepID=A0A9P5CW88_9EURO|nr:hypothetical protein H101_06981 [Trichophyton interdigitale H6]KAF3893784.1 Small nuclear ribonucleoprotein SmB [Trichophyton interdigitale]KDB23716.1 hypothetical protein H109_04396 [Trichophyton interdigitale MR816]GBF63495.1 small nuclear ribonucleoprotein-associated protein B [Trichophyton mentagrophytes]KAF3895188.1 Small nuclear ribonucleoprotein SmB [Trichophyton interdigitale]
MASNKQGKMQNLINYRMRVTLTDGRQMTGQMLAFDKHMNLVLADTEEFRRVKKKSGKGGQAAPGSSSTTPLVEAEEKRTLGLTIVRGTHVVSCSVDGPPPAEPAARLGTTAAGLAGVSATLAAGPGISKPAGRGLPVGLGGPAAGVGGPPPPAGFGAFPPPAGFPGGPPPGFGGRGGPPGGPPGFGPPPGFGAPGAPGGPPGGFQPPPGFQPPGQGRGFPPGMGGR